MAVIPAEDPEGRAKGATRLPARQTAGSDTRQCQHMPGIGGGGSSRSSRSSSSSSSSQTFVFVCSVPRSSQYPTALVTCTSKYLV